jgi:hypothetical protein
MAERVEQTAIDFVSESSSESLELATDSGKDDKKLNVISQASISSFSPSNSQSRRETFYCVLTFDDKDEEGAPADKSDTRIVLKRSKSQIETKADIDTVRHKVQKLNKRIVLALNSAAIKVNDNWSLIDQEESSITHDTTTTDSNDMIWPNLLEIPHIEESVVVSKGKFLGCIVFCTYLLPVLPKLFGDIWLAVIAILSMALFLMPLISIIHTPSSEFHLGFFILSIGVSLLLTLYAFIDGLTYRCYVYDVCQVKKHDYALHDWQSRFNMGYEIIRTVISEVIFYPLIVLCLYEILRNDVFDLTLKRNIIVLVILVTSCVYVLLSVYIVRPILIIVTIIRLQLITSSFNDYAIFFIRFLLHVIGQTAVHILCIVSVAMKIQLEGSITSPFLWIVMIGGWVIPLMGTISFFIVNYYWVQSLCVDVFIDVVKYLIKPEYSEAVFQSDNNYIEDSEKFFQITRHSEIMNEMETNREKIKFKTKFLYPLKVPLFILYGVTFCIIIAIYIVGLILDYNPGSTVTAGFGVDIGLTIFTVIAANLHFIMLTSLWCVIVILVEVPLIVIWPLWLTAKLIKNRLSKQSHDSNEYISLV